MACARDPCCNASAAKPARAQAAESALSLLSARLPRVEAHSSTCRQRRRVADGGARRRPQQRRREGGEQGLDVRALLGGGRGDGDAALPEQSRAGLAHRMEEREVSGWQLPQ